MRGPKSKIQNPKFARQHRSWAAIRYLTQDPIRGANHIRIFRIDDRERLVRRKFSPEVSAKRFRAVPIDDSNEHVAMNIVVPDTFGAENIVGIKWHRLSVPEAVDLGESVPLVNIEEHDPAGRGKEQGQFGKLTMEERDEVAGSKRFVVEDQSPAEDKPRDG